MHPNDDRDFDRLVDGELSAGERRLLLEALDATPEGWRRCALAFLEAQSWSEGLRHFVRESASMSASSQSSIAPVSVDPANRRSRRQTITWLAVAAGLLVAVTLAIRHRNSGPAANDAASNSESAAPLMVDSPDASPKNADGQDMLTLWVRDETGQQRPLRVPLVDADPLDRELGVSFQSGVPQHVRSQLQDRGYQVQSKRRYAPFMLENGRRMIVPVEDTKIVPVSQNVY